MDNLIKKLNALGLTKSEAQIYCSMLELGKTTVSAIAQKTEINRRNIYDSLSTLLDKGLAFQIIGEKEGKYGATAPEKLIELIQSKEIILNNVLPELEAKFAEKKTAERAVIYKGVEGFKNYLNDIINTGENIYCLGAKGGWGDKKLGEYSEWFAEERKKRKIKAFNLFDYSMIDFVKKNPAYNSYGECRILPEKFSTNSAIDIFGDHLVTFTGLKPEEFEDDVTLFVMISRELAESWRIWFKFLWDKSKKMQ